MSPNNFTLRSTNPTGAITNLDFMDPSCQPELMQIDSEFSNPKTDYASESPRDQVLNDVSDWDENHVVPECRKRVFAYSGDGFPSEDQVYTSGFEPSAKRQKREIEYCGIPYSQGLQDESGLSSWAMTYPEDQYLCGHGQPSIESRAQVYPWTSNQEVMYPVGPQEPLLDTPSCASLQFDNTLLEPEAVEGSMELEGDNCSLSTGEQASLIEETPETSPATAQSSESSAGSLVAGIKAKEGGHVCNAECTCKLCDTCFGMIQNSFSSSKFVPDNDRAPTGVSVKVQEEFVSLYHQGSGKFAGVADSTTGRVMGRLSKQFTVAYHSFIVPQDNPKQDCVRKYKLQTTIYGLRGDADAVGALLSTNDVFLQHPQETDPDKLYLNPHYLSWPGRDTEIPQYNTPEGIATSPDGSVLDEVGHTRVLRIFDSAQGPSRFVKPQIASNLKTPLKDYQLLALAMMFEKENGVIEGANFPSLWQVRDFSGQKRHYNVITKSFEEQGTELRGGGLIADDMGLGKTLTTLAFIASSIAASNASTCLKTDGSRRPQMSLVVAPKTAVPVWEEQIRKHFRRGTLRLYVYHGMARKALNLASLDHDIVITTYETLSIEWSRHAEKPLLSHTWHRVILDEAHAIRNSNSAKHRAVCDLKGHHRWCLTGTPVQNRIEDYGAILKFLRISPFLSKQNFNHYIADPIQSGRNEGFETLKTLVQATSLRRTKRSELRKSDLPARQLKVQSIALGSTERSIYEFFKRRAANTVFDLDGDAGSDKHVGNILPILTKLRQICNHSTAFLSPALLGAVEYYHSKSLYDTGLQQDKCDNCHSVLSGTQDIDLAEQDLPCSHSLCQKCLRMAQNDESEGTANWSVVCPICNNDSSRSNSTSPELKAILPKPAEALIEPSAKITALLQNLQQDKLVATERRCKSVVFSCWTRMLDLIEAVLNQNGIKMQRIDGSKSLSQRRDALKAFREESDCLVMLASIDCAGCGLDLTAANRVHLMEPHWNPMAEEQALDRVYRLGQTREVLAIRYIVKDSIEEYVQQIQKSKMDMISRTFGETGLSQHKIEQERVELLKRALR